MGHDDKNNFFGFHLSMMKSWPRPMDGPIDLRKINIDQFSGP